MTTRTVVVLLLAITLAVTSSYDTDKVEKKGVGDFSDAGMRIIASQAGFDAAIPWFKKFASGYLDDITMGDVSGSHGLPVGHVDYHLKNIKIHSFSFGAQPAMNLDAGSSTLDLVLNDLRCVMDLDFSWETHPIKIHGSGSATNSLGINVLLKIMPNRTQYGAPNLVMTLENINLFSFHVSIHGSDSFFEKILIDAFHSKLQDQFQSTMSKTLRATFDKIVTERVNLLPVVAYIDYGVAVSYALLPGNPTNPYIREFAMISDHYAEFFVFKDPRAKCAFKPSFMLPDLATLTHVQVLIHESLGNSLACTLHALNLLNYTLTNKNIPAGYNISLNTNLFANFVPAITKQYPNQPFAVQLAVTQSPSVNIDTTGMHLGVIGTVYFQVTPDSGPSSPLFGVNVTLLFDVLVGFHSGNITLNVTSATVNAALAWTTVGPIDSGIIDFAGEALVAGLLIPAFNKIANTGFPIPFLSDADISLFDTNAVYRPDYIALNTQFSA